mgnify:CR=1 FL=1
MPKKVNSVEYSPQAFVILHLAVLLFALSALFGKWIALSAILIVFGRAVFAAMALVIVCRFRGKSWQLSLVDSFKRFAFSGFILAIHWVTFFLAIQLSNVTLGLLTFASYPIFVCLIGVYLKQANLCWKTWLQAIMCLLGIYLALPMIDYPNDLLFGAVSGVISAASFALLTLVNQRSLSTHSASVLSLYQNAYAALWLLPFAVWQISSLNLVLENEIRFWLTQLALIALLGVVFTALSHTMMNYSLSKLSATLVSVTISLEPIYGIIAAIIFLSEPINMMIASGASLVLLANVWALRMVKPTSAMSE